MAISSTKSSRLLIVASILLVAVLAAGYWFVYRRDLPPDASTVVGQQLPASVTVVRTSRSTSGLLGRDGIDKAVFEIEERRFD